MILTRSILLIQLNLILSCCILSPTVIGQISSSSNGQVGNDMKLEEELFGHFSREEIRSNIASLYQAKLRAERAFKGDPVATLAEEMSENGLDYTCLRKQDRTSDFIYDNRTDFAKELKFSPKNYNCGKHFDIGKLLTLVRKYSKLKPYTVGGEAGDIDIEINKITHNEKYGNRTCSAPVAGPKPVVGKDVLFKSNNLSTTMTPHSKGGWWLGANQKNFPQENKAKVPLKNVTNLSTILPNLYMQNLNKGKKLIPTTKTYIKQSDLSVKYHPNLLKSEKLHKPITSSKQNIKEPVHTEFSILSQKNQPKEAEIPIDNRAKGNTAPINQQNQLIRNQNQKKLPQYPNGLLRKQENLAKSNNNYARQNLNNPQTSGNVPTVPEGITSNIVKIPTHH